MNEVRVLIVAPEFNDIDVRSEALHIADSNIATIRSGQVPRKLVEEALSRRNYDVVHIGTHGDHGVLELSDGNVTLEWLVRRLRNQVPGLRLVFLNGCNSVDIGIAIHRELHIAVVSHRSPIRDDAAQRFAEEFYGSLSNGATIGEAFNEARESVGRLFDRQEDIPQLINGYDEKDATLAKIVTAIDDLGERIARIDSELVAMKNQSSLVGGPGQPNFSLIIIASVTATVIETIVLIYSVMMR